MMHCPACMASESTIQERIGAYELRVCVQCRLSFCHPMKAGDESYYGGHPVYDRVTESMALQQLGSADNAANRRLISGLPRGARLLDIGCGFGAFVAVAVRGGMDAYGIDFNSAQIEMGRRVYRLGERLQIGRIESSPRLFVESSYDLVSLFEVIEHVESPRALLEQALRLIKPGGTLALSCPNEGRWQPLGRIFVDYPPHHLTRWRPETLERLLADIGFESVKIRQDASFRDIVWTAYVNRAARRRSTKSSMPAVESVDDPDAPGAGAKNWKHRVFDLAGLLSAPADLALRALRIGTMGMRVVARRPARSRLP